MNDDPSVYDDEIDLRAASNRLLSIALQSEFDKLIAAPALGASLRTGRQRQGSALKCDLYVRN